jgi:DNA polymerase-3 subunit delta
MTEDEAAGGGHLRHRLVLISGPEQVIAERGLRQTLDDLRVHAPALEVSRVEASGYSAGALAIEASPSLFGGSRAIVVNDLDEADDDLILDLMPLIEDPHPDPDLVIVVRHKSGQRGKRVLDALKKARAHVIEAPAIKNDRDKHSFAMHEFRSARRKATPQAVQALIEAVGSDVRELAAACQQLIDDTTGVIDETVVLTYHGGKVEATGFKVADAALAGDTGEALRLLRHAMAVGVSPVPMVAVIAMKIRQMIKVGAAGRGPSGHLAKQLGMAPFQVDLARRANQGWDGDRLGRCLQETAAADFAVKGGVATGGNRSVHAKDPEFVIERLILTIGELHRAEPARR